MSPTDRQELEKAIGACGLQRLSSQLEFIFDYLRVTIDQQFGTTGAVEGIPDPLMSQIQAYLEATWASLRKHCDEFSAEALKFRPQGSPARFQLTPSPGGNLAYALQHHNRVVGETGSALAVGLGAVNWLPSATNSARDMEWAWAEEFEKRAEREMRELMDNWTNARGKAVDGLQLWAQEDVLSFGPAREIVDAHGAVICYNIKAAGQLRSSATSQIRGWHAVHSVQINVPFATDANYFEEDPDDLCSLPKPSTRSFLHSAVSRESASRDRLSRTKPPSKLSRSEAWTRSMGAGGTETDANLVSLLSRSANLLESIFPREGYAHKGLREETQDVAADTADRQRLR